MKSKIRSFFADFFLFALFYASLIAAATAVYVHFHFGTVSVDILISALNDVFTLDWAVKKIKIYTSLLLIIAFLGVRFLKAKQIIILSFLLLFFPVSEFDVISYFRYKNTTTNFFEENYVAPEIEQAKKNNIIIIYLESFEDHFASKEVSPYLADLKEKNLSFNGFTQITSTFSTINAQFASMCAIILKQNNIERGDDYINFMPKISCVSDLLKKNGYNTAYFKAADVKFSRANYFANQHNFDVVKGLFELEDDAKKITKDYKGNVFGGLKDRVLFELLKKEIASLKEPFFATATSLDMHDYPKAYYDPECKKIYNDVRDIAHCTGTAVENFITWLEKQPFYKNTTLVILGDHQIPRKFISKSQVLNIFINSKKTTDLTNRKFTTFDFAPTILEAAGYNIEKFGVGRSLFSKNETLFEKHKDEFYLILNAKNKLFDELRTFENTTSLYNTYKLNTILDNNKLLEYTDFGEKNDWCNRTTILSMNIDNLPDNGVYLKMKYLKTNQSFTIFANDTKILEQEQTTTPGFSEEVLKVHLPKQLFKDGKKLSIKTSWPHNNMNIVFGLCIKEFSISDKE